MTPRSFIRAVDKIVSQANLQLRIPITLLHRMVVLKAIPLSLQLIMNS